MDRIPSDHASLTTYATRIERSGATRRPCLRVPGEADVAFGDVVRLVLDREEYHAQVGEDADGLVVRGAYESRSEAKSPADAENRLVAWIREHDRAESAVELDAVVGGEVYGLRVPGRRTVYEVAEGPSDSLRGIAERLDG